MRARAPAAFARARALGLALALGLAPAGALAAARAEPGEALRAHQARSALHDARAFRAQGRLAPAERAARRGLAASPGDARLLRELARALDGLDRAAEARAARERADALAPPPPPLPSAPLELASAGLLVVVGELDAPEEAGRSAADWPAESARAALRQRLARRLPEARIASPAPQSLAEARAWLAQQAPRAVLALTPERVHCGESLKDGPFGVARLRFAAAAPGAAEFAPARLERQVVLEPREPEGCEREVLARALEAALAAPDVHAALSSGAPARPAAAAEPASRAAASWSGAALRALFPGIGLRLRAELAAGEARLAAGELAAARESFARAAAIDPEDPEAQVYRAEVDASLALASELDRRAAASVGAQRALQPHEPQPEPAGALDPRLSEQDRRVLEALLQDEQRRRAELLAALAAVQEADELPAEELLRGLQRAPLGDPGDFGPELAQLRAGDEVEARAAHAPDGALLARYYFGQGAADPVLREEDRDGDGRADRWIGYADRARREVWEDARGGGRPDVHLVYGPGGGATLERIELDPGGDGEPDRIFYYSGEHLVGDARDSDGDGRVDRFDRFDARGDLDLIERDVDGDGRIDVRSHYQAGRLLRRELSPPADVAEDGS